MTDNPLNKFVNIGEPIICLCVITLGKRKDRNTITISKPAKGQAAVHINMEYQGVYKISCPVCGFGALFQHFEETTKMDYAIAPKTEQE